MKFITVSLFVAAGAVISASEVVPKAEVKVVGKHEVEGHKVGPGGEQITEKVHVDPQNASIFRHRVQKGPSSHSEVKFQSSVYVNYGDPEQEKKVVKDFIDASDFDVAGMKDKSEALLKD